MGRGRLASGAEPYTGGVASGPRFVPQADRRRRTCTSGVFRVTASAESVRTRVCSEALYTLVRACAQFRSLRIPEVSSGAVRTRPGHDVVRAGERLTMDSLESNIQALEGPILVT